MPLFFLHLVGDGTLTEDPEGSQLPDLDAARAEALGGIREILVPLLLAGKPLGGRAIRVTDEAGEVLAIVPFESAFSL